MNQRFDIIIIGSGAGGGTLARHLAPSGKSILILERGDWLKREAQNWDAAAVFVENRYVSPERWYDLLAFAHLADKRADAPGDEPDPVEEVTRRARQLLGAEAARYQSVTEDSAQAVPEAGEFTLDPAWPQEGFS